MNDAPPISHERNIHVGEMVKRIHWAIQVRWLFIGACLLTALGAALDLLPAQLLWWPFALICSVLAGANSLFRQWIGEADPKRISVRELRRQCSWHVLVDYATLAIVVYALGSIETPIMLMLIPNMVFGALFFTRRQSLAITLAGLALVCAPPLLEHIGLLPWVQLYAEGAKAAGHYQTSQLAGYLGLYIVIVLFSWYLITNITRTLVRNELELEAAYQDMLRLDEVKTRAMTQGTHELKAPLAAIKNYVYTLRDGYAGELPDKAQQIVLRIGQRVDRLMGKITDVMRLANLRSYVVTEQAFHPVDLIEILLHEAKLAQELATPRNIRLHLRLPDHRPVRVNATEEHIETLLSNILSNAVNYSYDDGEIDIELALDDGHVRLNVRDHGIGIGPEQRAKVFDEHYRTEQAVAHFENGTGLGLPIVKATAKLIDARVELHSELGQGTLITLSFPRLPEEGHTHGQDTDH